MNYIITAIRNFTRNKSITIIKILGLSLGLAVIFFVLIYVTTETSYNNYNTKKEKIFRVNQINHIHGWKTQQTPFPMRNDLISDFPEIDDATRIIHLNNVNILKNQENFSVKNFICTDKSFFNIFTTKILQGDYSTFSNDPYQIVVNETTALKYFGTSDIVNKSIKIKIGEKEYSLIVIAVIKDIPYTSTIKADAIANIEFGLEQANSILVWSDGVERNIDFYRTNWDTNFMETYILFKDKVSVTGFNKNLAVLEAKHIKDTTKRDYYIQNLNDIYLHSNDIIGGDSIGDLNSIFYFLSNSFSCSFNCMH